jgi:hypothetical protein
MSEDMSEFEAALGNIGAEVEQEHVFEAITSFSKRLGHFRSQLLEQGFTTEEAYSLVDLYAGLQLAPRIMVP